MAIIRKILLWGSRNHWLSVRLPKTWFMRRAVKPFMPGETIDAALKESQSLAKENIGTILTLLGENVAGEAEAKEVTDHYLNALNMISERAPNSVISVKPTQLGLDTSLDLAYKNIEILVKRAQELDTIIWVDMEGSEYLDATLILYRRLLSLYGNVGLAMQAYLYRTEADLEALLPLGPTIRLVKGAYAEPADIVWPDKSDVDANYLKLARRMLDTDALAAGTRPAFATHDPRMVEEILKEINERQTAVTAYEFQMLYGIGREAQRRLVEGDNPTNVLISYGDAWFPWYMRRLAERPANVWFVIRSVVS